jgi:hypothetical protein
MKENLKDILSNLNAEVDQQTLLRYLQGKLTADEQHLLEKSTIENDFDLDAIEGLQDFSNKAKIAALVEQLNQDLQKKTAKKKKWPHRRDAKPEPWLLIAIVAILLIAVIGYFIIHKMRGQ